MAKNTFRDDEKVKQTVNIKIIQRLLKYLSPYKLQVVKILALMAVIITVGILNPYFMKVAIDRYIEQKDVPGLLILGGAMALLNILAMVCTKYRIINMSKVSNGILLTIRQQLYNHIQKLSFSFFDNRPVGKILARIIGDVNSLNDLFASSITNLIPDTITLLSVVVIMLFMHFRLALVSLITLPLLLVGLFLIQTVSRKKWQIYRKKNSNLNAFIHEDYSGIRVVQSFTREKSTEKTFFGLAKDLSLSFIDAVRYNDAFWPTVEISWGLGSLVVFWYGVRLLNTEGMTVGVLVAFIGYTSMFWRPIMNLSNFYNTLVTNMAGAERIFEILDIDPDIVDDSGAKELGVIEGNVEFKNVSFCYDDGVEVLSDVSFKVKTGETIALVGHTGAGKTTIVNLISRFYDCSQGEVLIDGVNVKDVTLESLRQQMGIMMQDTFLFSGTIKDNIKYGKLDATDEEVIAAAKAVNAHDFVMDLEKGYDTDVNERGTRLSVGQRQLISLARALLADPRILILDEATSSIDTNTERLVQQGLKELFWGRTSFVIAHRLSTIRNADRIMVIEDGKILEVGSHEQLMAKRGMYYDLYMAQYKFLNEGA